jgi:formylglycine-generating enzyme required for sulfatase activity
MTNSLTKIFDNIGFSFRTKNNFFIPTNPIKGFNLFNSSHIGYYIPYLARSQDNGFSYEVGVGYITLNGTEIVIERYKVVKSSNNDLKVSFPSASNEFYVFANESNFNTAFNNVIVKESSFSAEALSAIYLLDSSNGPIDIALPSAQQSDNLVLEFKLITDNNPAIIRDSNGLILLSLSSSKRYTKLAYNNSWHELQNEQSISFSAESTGPTFSAQANAAGDIYSFQYNEDGSALAGSKMYWSSGNTNKLLLGSSSDSLAHTIIPTSGSGNVIFNNDRTSSNFIVYGSGNNNLFVDYRGRLGLNIPSGTTPETIVHIINTTCREDIRLENRSTCHPTNITMYYKPSGALSSNATVGEINIAGKNSDGNVTYYSKITSKAKEPLSTSQKGKMEIVVASGHSPTSGIVTISTDPDATVIGYSNNSLVVSGNTNTSLGFANTNINLTSTTATIKGNSINLQSQNIVLGSGNTGSVTIPSLIASNIETTNLAITSIAPNSILATDDDGNVTAGSNLVKFPSIPSGRILTTDIGGAITGIFYTDSFFLSDRDLSWNKYAKRSASICLRQIVPDSPVPLEEFAVGDQIAVTTSTTTYYRTVVSLDVVNNTIIGIVVNQNLSENTVSDVIVYSITKGGYFLADMYTTAGNTADATAIQLSIRPQTDTIFNTKHKDIDFIVYGIDPVPSLSVKANNGRSSVQSGEFFGYATQQGRAPFAIPVTTGGVGTSSTNNTVNYKSTASGSFSGMVTSVGTNGLPSYYGTYDQNGNVAEWVEDTSSISTSTTQYVAGGSWASVSDQSLHSLIPYVYSGGYNDIGFRICGSYGLIDNTYISQTLNLDFSSVANPNNPEDLDPVYISNTLSPSSSGIDNLGVVNRNYRIGTNEITNNQYRLFLNAVASTDNYGLYNSNMSGSPMGGISRSGSPGSYSYYTTTVMQDKPVVFVNYLSSIRFTNWLHNSAPTGTGLSNNITENGAYEITSMGANTYSITKNTYQNYWLPSINEWHKAAYFVPRGISATEQSSSVLVKTNNPYIITSGLNNSGVPYIDYASLSVSGWLYADKLLIGDGSFSSNTGTGGNNIISMLNGTLIVESGSHKVTIGNQNNLVVSNAGAPWDGTYGNVLANTGIVLSANGNITLAASNDIKFYSPNYIRISGLEIDNLKYKNLLKIDASGSSSATYAGPTSGLLYKQDDNTAVATSQMVIAGGEITMPNKDTNKAVYVDQYHRLTTFSGVSYANNTITMDLPLVVDTIQIGPELVFYEGSILTHNGTGPASWQPAEYLKAEGILWNRYIKRPVMVYDDHLVFADSPSLETLAKEFSYSDTIAVVNQETREINYVKAADNSIHIIDGPSPVPVPTALFVNGGSGPSLTFCPAIDWASNCASGVSGYAYSVTKGGYISMQIDQENNEDINSQFSCGVSSTGYFKPNTLNTISTRPSQPTAFNMLAENIDFVIYGAKTTLYHRYESSIFNSGADGLPSGLSAAFKIDANIPNAVSGDASSGVYFSGFADIQGTQPSGFSIDERAKISINTNNAYLISSIPSGTGTLGVYADLTVNGYTYSSGVIANDLFIRPLPDIAGTGKYIINAPLTINEYGQIISQVPQTAPTVPGSPTSLEGTAGNSAVTLSWVAPTNNGGRVVINYLIEYSVNGGTTWTTYSKPASTATTISITGLTNNVEYIFRVSAINSIGTGAPSITSDGVTPASNRPSQPQSLAVTRGVLSATLIWSAPVFGSPTNYVVEYSDDNGVTWSTYPDPDTVSTSTTVTIPGLLDNLRYLFRVKAENANGYGAYVEIASIGTDPYDPPTDPEGDGTSIWDFGKITFTGVCV